MFRNWYLTETVSAVPNRATTMDSLVRNVARIPRGPMATGTVLDQTYELIERVGGGGMGIVYRARDLKLGREVAIKVLKATDSLEVLHERQMFDREARATAQLLHPNIVTLHNVGEFEQQPYLVLELLHGETVAARIARRRQLPAEEALTIIDAVLSALVFAHAHGVLHRDLKPNNVFITVDDRVKVLDFGLALSLDSDPGPRTRSAGTPGYMAPEQQCGSNQDVRTDVWAAALFLVECICGKASSDAQVIDQLEVPRAVRKALRRALDPDPDMRPQTAAEFRNDLAKGHTQNVLSLTPATAMPSSRRRAVQLGGYAVAAALLIVAGFASGRWLAAKPPASTLNFPSITEVNNTSWTTANGGMQMHVDDDGKAYAVYEHDNGIIEGQYQDGVLTGWWCEEPTRMVPGDAGRIELRLVTGPQHFFIDGQWSYGDTTKWVTDLNGYSADIIGDPQLQRQRARLATHPTCAHH
jgi:serine/threonine protein kinase